MSVRVNFAFEKSEICIENSTKPNGAISGEWQISIMAQLCNGVVVGGEWWVVSCE